MKARNQHTGSAIADKNWRCPKCNHRLVKGGTAELLGRPRFDCKKTTGGCGWRGIRPKGYLEPLDGIDQKKSADIHARIVSARGVQRYAIVSAQNATPAEKPFLASLLTWCKVNKAQLIVIPLRYKNPTSLWTEDAEHDDWWAPELVPFLLDKRTPLNSHLVLLADIKTQPTAVNPLSGYETITGSRSAVIGHPQIALETVPTPQSRLPKLMVTTGSVTVKNYIPSKAGAKGEHHHSFGAAVVEIAGARFHIRQINAAHDGSFIDLGREYRGSSVRDRDALALVMGDTHEEFVDPAVVEATFGKGGIVDTLRPRYLIWHDLHDFYARNHWHKGDPFIAYVKHHSGHDNVAEALKRTFAFVDRVTPEGVTNIIVPSNHPDALARWIKETDPRTDPENCVFWAETFQAMCAGSKWNDARGAETIDPFAYWGRQWLKTAKRTRFLARDESFLVEGIEVGFHGDKGSNGARPSPGGFARIGVKTVTGHRHSPFIRMGAYGVGTNSRLRLGYNSGPSSWLQTDCAIYANGKRSLLHIIEGEWRAC